MFSATKKSQKSSAQNSSGFGHFLDASRGELHSRRYFNTYHLFLQAGCLGAEAKILSLHSASNQSFRKVLAFVGSCRPHWYFLFSKEKEAKAYLRGFPLDIPNQLYKDDAPLFCFYTSASTLSKSAK